jgi:NhaA family Na+:H+ antiporter
MRLEGLLHPWSAYVVVPLFALANAGVRLEGGIDAVTGPVGLGIIVGLLVGKPLGIVGSTWLLVRASLAVLPAGVTWRHMASLGVIAGIGFTMSLFIAELATLDVAGHRSAKLGVLAATTIAATVGWVLMRRAVGRDAQAAAPPDHRLP